MHQKIDLKHLYALGFNILALRMQTEFLVKIQMYKGKKNQTSIPTIFENIYVPVALGTDHMVHPQISLHDVAEA
jgi:hypothetical protein